MAPPNAHVGGSRLYPLLLVCAGLLILFVGALPVLLVPIQQDDLVFMFADNASSPSYLGVLDGKFDQLISLGRTNFLSAIGAGTHHYLIWHVGTATGLSLQAVERILFLVWLTTAVLAGAYFATAAFGHRLGQTPRERFATAFFVIAAVVGTTLQARARWSNDPAVSYPAWGFGSATVAFVYLGALVQAISAARIRLRAVAGLTCAGMVAVFWYEMNWVLLPVAALMVVWAWRAAPIQDNRGHFLTLVAGVGIPTLTLVGVRAYLLAHATETYSGTQPHLGSDSVVALGRGVFGSLPASAWPLTAVASHQAGTLSLGWRPVVAALLLVTLVVFSLRALVSRLVEAGVAAEAGSPPSFSQWLPVTAVLLYWIGTICAFALTVKYARELYRLGTVYAFYAPATIVLGVLVVALVPWLCDRLRHQRWAWPLGAGLVAFVVIQTTLSWSLLDTQRVDMATATRLVDVADNPDANRAERCRAIDDFTDSRFPFYGYPAESMRANLDLLEGRRSGQNWCPSISPAPAR
jgi:hypothetical protein